MKGRQLPPGKKTIEWRPWRWKIFQDTGQGKDPRQAAADQRLDRATGSMIAVAAVLGLALLLLQHVTGSVGA